MDAHFSNARRGRRRALLPLPIPSDIFTFPGISIGDTTSSSTESLSATSSSQPTSTTSTSKTSSLTSSTSTEAQTSTSITPTPTSTSTTATSTFEPDTLTVTQSGSTITVIQSTQAAASASPSSTAVTATQQSFLQNKVLAGIVLSFAGLIGLILIISVVAFFIRRRKNNRIVEEALSFDPVPLRGGSPELSEKRNPGNIRASSSTGRTNASYGNAPLVIPAGSFTDYAHHGPYTFNRTPNSVQKVDYSADMFPNGQQPHTQGYKWTSTSAQDNAGYQYKQQQVLQPVAEPEVDPPRSSQASSGEFQFASVAPLQQAARRQDA